MGSTHLITLVISVSHWHCNSFSRHWKNWQWHV